MSNTTAARFVTTVDEFMELIDAAVEGLLPQAYAAMSTGTLASPVEFVRERATLIANVVNIEADDILGLLISLGHTPEISNDDAQHVVEVALARALTQRMSEDRLTASVEAWHAKVDAVQAGGPDARNLDNAMELAQGALGIIANLYDYALRCGVQRHGSYAVALRDTYTEAFSRLQVEDAFTRELEALALCKTVAQVLNAIDIAGGPVRFMVTVANIERGAAAA